MFLKAILLYTYLLRILPLSRANVYNYLWRHYSSYTSKLFREIVIAQIQIYTVKSAISFINTCKQEDLAPTFIRFRVANPYLANSPTVRQCQQKILQGELNFKRNLLNRTKRHFNRLDEELKRSVPHIIYVRLWSISDEIVNRKMNEVQVTNESKLAKLRADKLGRMPQQQTLDPITNLSSYNLTDNEHTALFNGLNHVYPPEKFDQP